MIKLTVSTFLLQDAVLSPVQDGENKPQMDSNQENNYEVLKCVSFMSSFCRSDCPVFGIFLEKISVSHH